MFNNKYTFMNLEAKLRLHSAHIETKISLFTLHPAMLAGGGKSRYYSKGAGEKNILSLES